jgi:hypothetical protein
MPIGREILFVHIQLKLLTWRAAPVIADVVAIILYLTLVPRLTTRFQDKSALNAAIVGGVYVLFCVSVFYMRRLEGEAESAYLPSSAALAFFGVCFGIFVTYIMAEGAGVFDNPEVLDLDLDNTGVSVGLFVGSIAWLAFFLLYPGILIADIQPSIARGSSPYFWVELLTLLGTNLMVIVTVAHWEAIFSDTTPYEGLGLGAKLLIFCLTFIFFLLFYGPPRLLFLSKKTHPTAVVTFLLQLGYFVWSSLARTAW